MATGRAQPGEKRSSRPYGRKILGVIDPASRQVRLALGEKRLAFTEVVVRVWEQLAGGPLEA